MTLCSQAEAPPGWLAPSFCTSDGGAGAKLWGLRYRTRQGAPARARRQAETAGRGETEEHGARPQAMRYRLPEVPSRRKMLC